MLNYDFTVLQYNEFECLTRDLLQAEFGSFIESFKDGRDNGIDLRFGRIKGSQAIVQVKRYTNWTDLKKHLEKEIPKVQKLDPNRYILSTSVGLTPGNKETIIQLFAPYIKCSEDILGRDDLNNLVGKHKEIEKQYYKLWLASTDVLNEIIHKDVVNWSGFELETIKRQISSYVQNDSFRKAYEILKEHRYVIISGIPGIGKTTLARMLSYQILADGYEEFICITDNLNDAAKLFQKGKKQIFYFDDFLGSNTFEIHEKGFDKNLTIFIDAVQNEKDKLFILTTREYILSEAKCRLEKFQSRNLEIAKCTVDIGSYTKYIRAKILYNHIADANLPAQYIEELLRDRKYLNLIDHQYFNPRVIETYIDCKLWEKYPPGKFMQQFEEFFNKPTMVWQKAFENLDTKARYALLVLGTMGKSVYLENWHDAFKYFCRETHGDLGLTCDEFEWKRILKVLEDCFIRTEKSYGHTIIFHYNPSILGFIVSYLSDCPELQKLLIKNSCYTEQLCSIFRDSPISYFRNDAYVIINENLYQVVVDKFTDMMQGCPKSCRLSYCNGELYGQRGYDEILFFLKFSDSYPIINKRWNLLEKFIIPEEFTCQTTPFSYRAELLSKLNWDKIDADLNAIIDRMEDEPKSIAGHRDYLRMLESMNMTERLESKYLINRIEDDINYELENNIAEEPDINEISDLIDEIQEIVPSYRFLTDFSYCIKELRYMLIDTNDDHVTDLDRDFHYLRPDNDKRIDEMMTSLRFF